MTGVWTIVRYGLEEALRRKVFVVVLLLTLAFLGLYALANHYAFENLAGVAPPAGIDARTFAGAFIFGLAMFATLFLGVVLAVFLTLGVVRGDAERGLLQPLVVRPVGRATVLVARFHPVHEARQRPPICCVLLAALAVLGEGAVATGVVAARQRAAVQDRQR